MAALLWVAGLYNDSCRTMLCICIGCGFSIWLTLFVAAQAFLGRLNARCAAEGYVTGNWGADRAAELAAAVESLLKASLLCCLPQPDHADSHILMAYSGGFSLQSFQSLRVYGLLYQRHLGAYPHYAEYCNVHACAPGGHARAAALPQPGDREARGAPAARAARAAAAAGAQ